MKKLAFSRSPMQWYPQIKFDLADCVSGPFSRSHHNPPEMMIAFLLMQPKDIIIFLLSDAAASIFVLPTWQEHES